MDFTPPRSRGLLLGAPASCRPVKRDNPHRASALFVFYRPARCRRSQWLCCFVARVLCRSRMAPQNHIVFMRLIVGQTFLSVPLRVGITRASLFTMDRQECLSYNGFHPTPIKRIPTGSASAKQKPGLNISVIHRFNGANRQFSIDRTDIIRNNQHGKCDVSDQFEAGVTFSSLHCRSFWERFKEENNHAQS
jgi:hypothetical protein